MRRFLALIGLIASLLLWLGPTLGHAQQDPASRALHFLSTQQAADGHVDGFDASQGTEDYLLAAAAAGYDPNAMKNPSTGRSGYDYLAANVAAATSTAGRTGRLLQALSAGGRPATFAGVDLQARLQTYYSAGLHPGEYGDSDAFSQALVITGLKAAGLTVPPAALQFLKGLQNPDGSWYFSLTPQLGDTNDTALALAALDAAGDHSRDASALAYLHTQQQPDGGFPYQAIYPGSDPDSTGLVIEALLSSGQAPTASAWSQPGGGNPYSYLLASQDPASGGFIGYSGTPDAATTVQAVVGLALSAVPVPNSHGSQFGLCAAATSGVAALRFLATQQGADGHVDGFTPSQGTEDYILGAAAAGYDPGTLRAASGKSAFDYLAANVGPATASAGSTGRLLEAVRAAGRPTTFAGVDLVARLQSLYSTQRNGEYGDSDAFSQSLAILGLKSAGASVPASAVTFLKGLQNSDGSWYFSLTPQAGDTNDTALALMALAAVGDHSLDAGALAWLRNQQAASGDGGFPYQGQYPPSDPDSTALVLQALYATQQDPAAWIAAGATPISFLASGQAAGGGYPGYSGTPDAATTVPVVAALERLPYPIPPSFTAGRALSDPGPTAGVCPSPSPSPSPSPTPTPTPTATPTPTPTPTAAPTGAPAPPPAPEASAPEPAGSAPTPTPTDLPSPSPAPVGSPTASPSPSAMPSPSPAATTDASAPGVTTTTSGGAGGLPPALLYGLAALGGLLVVVGGGAAFLFLRRR